MASKKDMINVAKEDFRFLQYHDDVLAVLFFGSVTKGELTERSDVDICIVAPTCRDREVLRGEIYKNVDVVGKGYDVWIFEELPLYMKAQVIKNNVVIHARNQPEFYEYLYFFRKLWKDQEHRQKIGKEEALRMLT